MNHKDISNTFTNLFQHVDDLISEMKLKSSDEILNGSVSEAQKLLGKIIPYQLFFEKLKIAKHAFDEIENGAKNVKKGEEEKVETLDQADIDLEIVEQEVEKPPYAAQDNFRIPILKALIFLGGSSEENEIVEFVKKDMKNKLSKHDFEIPDGEDKERWLSNLYFETADMMDEGLLSNEATNKKWEIAQKGIDYLGKYAK